jgi:hypothetical protein
MSMNVSVVKTFLSDGSAVYDVRLGVGTKVVVLDCEDEIAANTLAHELMRVTNQSVVSA